MGIRLLKILNNAIQEQGGKFKDLVDNQGRRVGDTYYSVEVDDDGKVTKVLKPGEKSSSGVTGKFILGDQTNIDNNGPQNHSARALGDWQSDNATDIFGSPGTVVHSITKGSVSKVGGNESVHRSKIYGGNVTVTGVDGYSDVFYTHMQNIKVSVGDVVDLGTPIGEISNWEDNPSASHVHVGLPFGQNLSTLVNMGTGEIILPTP